ncbi:MAG: hypothetical protein ACI39R_08195 [Lachnospiraceae bacterium]
MESINVPRSNRIIGKPEKDCRIYIEDYVKSYIARVSQDVRGKGNIEILYGKYKTDGKRMEIDIGGAAALSDWGVSGDVLKREIEVINLEFFPDLEPVGWFYNKEKTGKTDYARLMDIHEELLGEQYGILVLPGADMDEPEVYSYEEDGFRKHRGYVVYYDKNTEMQEYLLAHMGKTTEPLKFKDIIAPIFSRAHECGGASTNKIKSGSKNSGAINTVESEGFRQRIISLPSKIKDKGRENFSVSLGVSILITGLLAVILAGMLIAFKTYYYTNFNDTVAYVKDFIRYCFGDGG